MNVSEYIFDYLYKQGVRHVFYLSGGGCMYLVDALGRSKIEGVPMLHEQAAGIAAEAYGQYTGLGVCLVTTGPGATNAITGVLSAWIDSVPLLVISGQVKTADSMEGTWLRQKGVQEADIISMVESITNYSFKIKRADEVGTRLEIALYNAMNHRKGGVWLDIPLDIQNENITTR